MSVTGEAVARLASDAGTTLVEALVAVAIVGLMTAIAFPRLQQGVVVLAQHHAVALLTARVREARAAALGQDTPVVFDVGADGRSYGATGGPQTKTPPGVTLTTSRGGIAFYGDGSSSGGVIRIRGGRQAMRVEVARAGGAVAMAPE